MNVTTESGKTKLSAENVETLCGVEAVDGLVHISFEAGSAHFLAVITPAAADYLAERLLEAAHEADPATFEDDLGTAIGPEMTTLGQEMAAGLSAFCDEIEAEAGGAE